METDKGSLEPSPNPAVFMNEAQEESGGRASPETCSSERVMDLDEYSQSSREQEAMGRDTTWKGTFEPSLLIKYQIINIDMRRSWYPRSHKNPSSNTKSVATNPEDVYFDEQSHKLKFQGFTDWQKQAQSQATCLLLQDCATERLLKDCHLDIFIATNTLASQESLCCSETLSSGDTSDSRTYDVTLSGGSSQGQQETLRRQPQHKSQHRKFISTDARETNRNPKLGQHRKWLVVRKSYQACRMSHPAEKKESAESLQSKSHKIILMKAHISSENHFRERIKHFLQWTFPNKAKDRNSPCKKASCRRHCPEPGNNLFPVSSKEV